MSLKIPSAVLSRLQMMFLSGASLEEAAQALEIELKEAAPAKAAEPQRPAPVAVDPGKAQQLRDMADDLRAHVEQLIELDEVRDIPALAGALDLLTQRARAIQRAAASAADPATASATKTTTPAANSGKKASAPRAARPEPANPTPAPEAKHDAKSLAASAHDFANVWRGRTAAEKPAPSQTPSRFAKLSRETSLASFTPPKGTSAPANTRNPDLRRKLEDAMSYIDVIAEEIERDENGMILETAADGLQKPRRLGT